MLFCDPERRLHSIQASCLAFQSICVMHVRYDMGRVAVGYSGPATMVGEYRRRGRWRDPGFDAKYAHPASGVPTRSASVIA